FLLLLEVLKSTQLRGGVLPPLQLPVESIELEMRGCQQGIQGARSFELLDGGRLVAAGFENGTDLVMRYRLIGDQFSHALELCQGGFQVALFFERDPEIEP